MENHLRKNNGPVRHHCVIGGGMAYFYRLIFAGFLSFAAWFPTASYALIPATNGTLFCLNNGTYCVDSGAAAKASYKADWEARSGRCGNGQLVPGMVVYVTSDTSGGYGLNHYTGGCDGSPGPYYNSGGSWQFSWTKRTALSCPANSTLSGSSCTCNTGFTESGGTCKSTAVVNKESCDSLASGLNLVGDALVHYGGPGLTACFGGFVVSGSGSASGGGQTELYGPFACSGESAQSCSVATKPADITATCAVGSYPGTVNGVQVCVPPSSSTTAPEKNSVTPPAPGASAPVISDAPPGTTSTEKSTTCTGTDCTTTTIYKDASGSSLGEKKEEKPKKSFCEENPKFAGCKELVEGKFAGTCGSVPACTGDPIQCAAAKAAFASACVLDVKANAESALYDAAKTVDQSKSVLTESQVSITSSMFNSSNILGAGSGCIADKNVTISGHSMTLPFSSICQYLEYIGFLNLAIAFVLAGRIVARG